MSRVTEILLLVDRENDPEVRVLGSHLTKLNYIWSVQLKSEGLTQIPTCQLILFKVGKDITVDLSVLHDLRNQVAYLPVVVLSDEAMNVPPAVAKLGNAILHTPPTQIALERKILRHLEPREGHYVRVYDRMDVNLKVTWCREKINTPKESETTNVSRGGAFIREGHFFPNRGDIVEVIIKGKKSVVSGKAIVRWIYSPGSASNNTPGFGIEFLILTPSGQQFFNSLGLG